MNVFRARLYRSMPGWSPHPESFRMESRMTVHVDELNYRMEQSYNLALAIWSLLEQNAASLRADVPPTLWSALFNGSRRRDIAEVCEATGAHENEAIRVF